MAHGTVLALELVPKAVLLPALMATLQGTTLIIQEQGKTTAENLTQTHLLLLCAYIHHRCQQKSRGCHHVQQSRSEN